ncbi:hypothetical protein ABPG72_002885 [Tetrahymena utriculariae]
MNKQLLLLALLGIALVSSTLFLLTKSNKDISQQNNIAQLWSGFKKTFHKRYADPDQEQYRIQVFYSNFNFFRLDTKGTSLSMPYFFDLAKEEFQAMYLIQKKAQDRQNSTG